MSYPKLHLLSNNISLICHSSVNKCKLINNIRKFSQFNLNHTGPLSANTSLVVPRNTNDFSTSHYSNNAAHITNDEKDYKFRNVLLIRKITRYEYERQLLKPISKEDFKARVRYNDY